MASWRRSRNCIRFIKDSNEAKLTEQEDIQKAFVEHFQRLFSRRDYASSEMCVLQSATGSTMDLQEDTATWTFIIDGSWWAKGLKVGAAWICYDANQRMVGQHATALHCPSPLTTEAIACLEAVH